MTYASDFLDAELERVRRSWGWFLIFGVLLTALGAMCIIKAQTATTFSILALGWVLAIGGVFWLVNAFWALNWHGLPAERDHLWSDVFYEKGSSHFELRQLLEKRFSEIIGVLRALEARHLVVPRATPELGQHAYRLTAGTKG